MKTDTNEIRKRIKTLLANEGITITDLVDEYNAMHPDDTTTRQNVSNKLARESITYKEVIALADCIGYDVEFIKRS